MTGAWQSCGMLLRMFAPTLAQPWFPSVLAEGIGLCLLLTTALGIALFWALALLADSPSFTADCDPDAVPAEPTRPPWRAALLRPGWLVSSGVGAALLFAGLALGH